MLTSGLTGSNGSTWQRQRELISTRVLPVVLGTGRGVRLASELADRMCEQLASDINNRGGRVDLKQLLEPVVLEWICTLVAGREPPARQFGASFIEFLKAVRAERPCAEQVERLRAAFVEQIDAVAHASRLDDAPCLLDALEECCVISEAGEHRLEGRDEVYANVFSFMMAGFETTLHVLTMSVLLLGSHKRLQRLVHEHCIEIGSSAEQQTRSLEALRQIKQTATQARSIDGFNQLLDSEPLVRSIVQVLRVTPPVWGLPRVVPQGCASTEQLGVSHLRVDVVACNGVSAEWPVWEPMRAIPPNSRMLSFGVGARACPAGTTALQAAFTVLRRMFERFEVDSDGVEVLEAAYLKPTLVVQGQILVSFQDLLSSGGDD